MKVQIGRHGRKVLRALDPNLLSDLNFIRNQITEDVLEGVKSSSVDINKRWLRELAALVKQAAMQEAAEIFPTLERLITNRPGAMGFSNTNLGLFRGTEDRLATPLEVADSVDWKDLSWSHIVRKKNSSYPSSVNQMFRYTGGLANYFGNQSIGKQFVRSSLGGVSVEVRPKFLYNGNKPSKSYSETFINPNAVRKNKEGILEPRWTKEDIQNHRTIRQILIGSITVKIFPKLSPSLLPMMSSNRWAEAGNGNLERSLFKPDPVNKIGAKLVNKDRPYRPLLTPVLQFWIGLRIPDTITRRVAERFNRMDAKLEK